MWKNNPGPTVFTRRRDRTRRRGTLLDHLHATTPYFCNQCCGTRGYGAGRANRRDGTFHRGVHSFPNHRHRRAPLCYPTSSSLSSPSPPSCSCSCSCSSTAYLSFTDMWTTAYTMHEFTVAAAFWLSLRWGIRFGWSQSVRKRRVCCFARQAYCSED